MNDLLKYAEEPGTITRDSLMNFEIGAIVEYNDRQASVVVISERYIWIKYIDTEKVDRVLYIYLHVIALPVINHENEGKAWTKKDHNFLVQNIELPNANLSRLLGRSESSIANRKSTINHTKKF